MNFVYFASMILFLSSQSLLAMEPVLLTQQESNLHSCAQCKCTEGLSKAQCNMHAFCKKCMMGDDCCRFCKECPVCLERISSEGEVRLLCNHSFCLSCISEWENKGSHKGNVTCPTCRAKVVVKSRHNCGLCTVKFTNNDAITPITCRVEQGYIDWLFGDKRPATDYFHDKCLNRYIIRNIWQNSKGEHVYYCPVHTKVEVKLPKESIDSSGIQDDAISEALARRLQDEDKPAELYVF